MFRIKEFFMTFMLIRREFDVMIKSKSIREPSLDPDYGT